MSPDPPTGKCSYCRERDATIWWSTDAMSFIHGSKRATCGRCSLEKQLAYAEEQASRIPGLREELERLA